VFGAADAVVGAIKAGAVKRFFFIGGCDGTEGERNYFTDLAKAVPDDAMILTAGCAKFRFNRLLEGKTVGPFPKVLDMGQCNDISGAIAVAMALADKLGCKVGDLPLEFGVSWLEQKGGVAAADVLASRTQGHQARTESAGIHHAQCAQRAGGEVSARRRQRRRQRTLQAK
jgi:hydroxylamine reductase